MVANMKKKMRDNLSLIRVDNSGNIIKKINNVAASVTTGTISIADGSLPIEEGDTLMRLLPSGKTEYFRIVDRGYLSIDNYYKAIVERYSPQMPPPSKPDIGFKC